MSTNSDIKKRQIFECKICYFRCSKNCDYVRHTTTRKHQMLTNVATYTTKTLNPKHQCECGKEYKHRQSLSVHRKACTYKEPVAETDMSDKEIIKLLIKENSEFKNMLLDVVQKVQLNNNTNNNNTNSHNTTNNNNNINNINNTTNNNFNLQIYLNETCKDAINLVDFVDSLQVQLKDLEETARLGYSEGVSKIFINGLNELEVNKRPIHCSDAKRETLYIKDENEWTKEDSNKTHLMKAIKKVGRKNIQQIFEWQKKYPEFNDPKSKQNDKYLKMICNTMSGSTEEEQEKNINKIIKNITKEVIINKNL